jgi:hypothetical protein
MFQRAFLGSCPERIQPPRRPQFKSISSQQLQTSRKRILLSTLAIYVLTSLDGGCGAALQAVGEVGRLARLRGEWQARRDMGRSETKARRA